MAGYSVDALDNAAVWGLFQEKARENSLDESELRKLLGEIGRRNDDRFIRWIHYAASGLYSEITYPKKRITAEKRRNIELIRKNYLKRKDFETADRYLPEKLYFSWDEKASSGEKFETWWRETTGLN